MQNNNFPSVVESLLKGMDTVLSTKTVVGEATQIGDERGVKKCGERHDALRREIADRNGL